MSHSAHRWPVSLEHGDTGLRALARSDESMWTRVRQNNASWLQRWEPTTEHAESAPKNYKEMWRKLNRSAKEGTGMPFVITSRHSLHALPRFVGQLNVSNITYGAFRSCTMGYWVDEGHAGLGIAPTAVALAADYCFSTLKLHRVELNIRPENAPSLRVAQKLGFIDEGVRPRYLHIDGAWRDHRSFAIFAEDFPDGVLAAFARRQEDLRHLQDQSLYGFRWDDQPSI